MMITTSLIDDARRLTDQQLLAHLQGLATQAHHTTVDMVAHLAELDARRLYLAQGFPPTFVYCRKVLRLSESEAYDRIKAARAARRFPVVLGMLAEGALNVTAVRLLRPHLTAENHVAVLESARGKSKREVEELVARLAPRPDVPTSIRKLPTPRPEPAVASGEAPPVAVPPSFAPPLTGLPLEREPATTTTPLLPPAPSPVARAVVSPLAPDRYKMQLTIDGEMVEMLQLAKDMLSHAEPAGDDQQVLKRAVKALLVELAHKKFAATERPRRSRGVAEGSRHVSAEVKRSVWVRDLGRCAFVGGNGRRCGDRAFLEFHHVKPHAFDGPPILANIELRCQAHNQYEWRLWSSDVRGIEEEWLHQQSEREHRHGRRVIGQPATGLSEPRAGLGGFGMPTTGYGPST